MTRKAVGVIFIAMPGLLFFTGCALNQSQEVKSTESKTTGYNWRQTDSSVALLNNGHIVWQLNYKKEEGRPYFHPLCLTNGEELTWLRPPDHPWHRALWFSWKYINGRNYWEEDNKTGRVDGETEVVSVKVAAGKNYSAGVEMSLSYHPPNKPAVLTEKRLLDISAPDETGSYHIDWCSTFTAADKDVLLNRTPIMGQPGGVSWGGYAGLSIRLAKGTSDWQATDSEGHRYSKTSAKNARWLDFNFKTANGTAAGIAVFDHPENMRNPTPWYVIMNPQDKSPFGYFSPAVLYNEPYTLAAGESFTLRYRILVHPGGTNIQFIESESQQFSKTEKRRQE